MRIREVSEWPTTPVGPSKISQTNVRRLMAAIWLSDAIDGPNGKMVSDFCLNMG